MPLHSLQISRRSMLAGLGGFTAAAFLSDGSPVTAAPPPAEKLPRTTLEEAGISADGIVAFLDAVDAKVGGLHSFMLLRHGKVASEGWWAPYAPKYPHMLYSLSKSFTSTAVGLAVADGKLTVEDL